MTDTVCFPVTELVNIDAMASVATAVWWCRLCGSEATAASRPAAHSDAVAHLTAEHHATIGIAPSSPGRPPVEPNPPCSAPRGRPAPTVPAVRRRLFSTTGDSSSRP